MSGGERGARRRILPALAVGALLALFGARLLHTSHEKTLTVDEPHYIGTALYLWETGDYHFARSLRFHPPLAYHLAGLPLLAMDLEAVEASPTLGATLTRGTAEAVTRVRVASRLPFVLLTLWGAVLVLAWGRELAGPTGGLLALFLYSFSPVVLGHGSLAHSDGVVTVFYLQTLYAFWRWSRTSRPGWLVATGLSLGLALASKANALLLLPSLALLLLWNALRSLGDVPRPQWRRAILRHARRASAAGLAVGALAVVVLWASYGGSFAIAPGRVGSHEGVELPGYLHGLLFDSAANAAGRRVYFWGEILERGRWYQLPVTYFLKAPVGLWILLAAAALGRRPATARAAPHLLIPLLVYLLAACFWLQVPLGVRYLLPVVPLLHLLAATSAADPAPRAARAAAVLAVAWTAASSLASHPHYLAYANELIGGSRNARHYFAESNLDWGQDARTLARFLQKQGNPAVHLAFFGPEPPSRYGARTTPIRGCDPVGGIVAISVNILVGLYHPSNPFRQPPPGCFAWLRDRPLLGQPGYSVLVFGPEAGP